MLHRQVNQTAALLTAKCRLIDARLSALIRTVHRVQLMFLLLAQRVIEPLKRLADNFNRLDSCVQPLFRGGMLFFSFSLCSPIEPVNASKRTREGVATTRKTRGVVVHNLAVQLFLAGSGC